MVKRSFRDFPWSKLVDFEGAVGSAVRHQRDIYRKFPSFRNLQRLHVLIARQRQLRQEMQDRRDARGF